MKTEKRKYNVSKQGNSIFVLNNRTGFCAQYHITEFIYGQMGYNERTEKYPNYVHAMVWNLTK